MRFVSPRVKSPENPQLPFALCLPLRSNTNRLFEAPPNPRAGNGLAIHGKRQREERVLCLPLRRVLFSLRSYSCDRMAENF
jgi:hypothetical protein